jgi:low temperature requirement protein LtrA
MREWIRSLFNPTGYRPDNLARTWVQERVGAKLMRLATVMVVLMLCTNLVSLPLAGYIDAVGLDAALSMLDLQLSIGLALLAMPLARFIRRKTPRSVRVTCLRRMKRLRSMQALLSTPWWQA